MGHILVQQQTITKRVEGRTVVKKKRLLEQRIVQTFPKWMENINLHVKEVKSAPRRRISARPSLR